MKFNDMLLNLNKISIIDSFKNQLNERDIQNEESL